MSLIVEDGSIVAGAESYCTTAYADDYFLKRGNSVWGPLDITLKEAMLRLATEYMLHKYRMAWAGYRVNATQNLDWPRLWVPVPDVISTYGPAPTFIAYNVVPDIVMKAACELAFRSYNADGYKLLNDLDQREDSVKIGSILISYNKDAPMYTVYREVDMMLKPMFLMSGSGVASIVRT